MLGLRWALQAQAHRQGASAFVTLLSGGSNGRGGRVRNEKSKQIMLVWCHPYTTEPDCAVSSERELAGITALGRRHMNVSLLDAPPGQPC